MLWHAKTLIQVLVFCSVFLEKYDRTLRKIFCKVQNKRIKDSKILAFLNSLASAVEAKACLSEIFGSKHEDGTYNDAVECWYGSARFSVPRKIIQKTVRSPYMINKISQIILKLEPTDVKRFYAH